MVEKYKKKVTKTKEMVHVLPVGKNQEFRFAIVDVDGKQAGDMRYFEKGRYEDIMLPTKRGIPFPENPEAFLEGFEKLRKRLQAA
ncbi:MAG TPA: hypothetical protein PLO78_05235 [Candidatus Omnitrophota bacterium]|nr:hypothetical protein [Candidatus Omnitrophota bacterium]